MNRFRMIVIVSVLAGGIATASAQTMAPAAQGPVTSGLAFLFAGIEANVMQTAETAPDTLYSYRAAPGVRTFGQILAHIADAQKALCAATRGGNVNLTDDIEKTATTRPAIVAALKETFAGCRAIVASLTDLSAATTVPFGDRPAAVSTLLAFTIAHGNEHYGNLVTYLRLNGLVPPSSRGGQ